MDKENCCESNTLIFKNIPKQVGNLEELLNFLQIPAKHIKSFGRRRALISYESACETSAALEKIQQLQFSGKVPNISLFCKDKPKDYDVSRRASGTSHFHKSVQTNNDPSSTSGPMEFNQLKKYVRKLYATEENLSFDQPPPPYLKYQYPPVNKDILDNICMSLLSNKKFYTQVLHLMNRMNLEPPFGERKIRFVSTGELREAFTQTDEVMIGECTKKEDSESELESSDEKIDEQQPQITPKRKLPPSEEQYKKKARQMFHTIKKLSKEPNKKSISNATVEKVFDSSSKPQSSKIKLHISKQNTGSIADSRSEENVFEADVHEEAPRNKYVESSIDLPLNLSTQKIGITEMQDLAVFKNYKKGERSNKLYIKNLQKDVVTQDLYALYKRFIQNDSIQLDVKVMQHGRMKGQGFVTFHSQHMPVEGVQEIVSQALDCTNGFILRQKPMVVCFGKQSGQKDN